MRRFLLCCCCTFATLWTACSDGNLRGSFSLDLLVEDLNGDPVEGLRVQLHVPVNDVSIKTGAKRASTTIRFATPRQVHGELNVLDLDGEILRRLFAGDLQAGEHVVQFDGKTDSSDVLVGTVPFLVEAIFRENAGSSEVWRGESACVLYTGMDLDQQALLGLTDADGRLQIEDSDPFPFLSELPIFEGRDETGADTGVFSLSSNVELWLIEESSGNRQVEIVDIGPRSNDVEIVWDPIVRAPRETEAAATRVDFAMDASGGPPVFRLDVCIPNPFN